MSNFARITLVRYDHYDADVNEYDLHITQSLVILNRILY